MISNITYWCIAGKSNTIHKVTRRITNGSVVTRCNRVLSDVKVLVEGKNTKSKSVCRRCNS